MEITEKKPRYLQLIYGRDVIRNRSIVWEDVLTIQNVLSALAIILTHDKAIKYVYFVSEFKAGCSLYIAIPCYRCESLSVKFWSCPQASCKKWEWYVGYTDN